MTQRTITIQTHAELFEQAARLPLTMALSKGSFTPGAAQLRGALGVAAGQTLEVWALVDRSGSVRSDLADNQSQVTLAEQFDDLHTQGWDTSGRQRHTSVAIIGFDGTSSSPCFYEFKPVDRSGDRALRMVPSTGGRATPTADVITYASEHLAPSGADVKVILVITDGQASEPDEVTTAIETARADGVRVIAALKGGEIDAVAPFGADYFEIAEYPDVPEQLLRHLGVDAATEQTPSTPACTPSSAYVQYVQPSIVAAARAVLALGTDAAAEFYSAHVRASDPRLREVADCVHGMLVRGGNAVPAR